jgi:predicted ATPase
VVRQAGGLTSGSPTAAVREAVAEMVRGEESADRIVQGVAQMIGAEGAAGGPEEMFWSTRRLLEIRAEERPLVVLFDDVQWGEPTFLDFVEYLTDFGAGPLLLVCPARPDLLDHRADWGAGRPNTTRVTLDSLTPTESTLLIRNLLRAATSRTSPAAT